VLPLWSAFEYPERFLVLPTLALALATGFGVAESTAARRWQKALFVVPVAAGAAVLAWPGLLGAGAVGLPASVEEASTQALAISGIGMIAATLVRAASRRALITCLVALDFLAVAPKVRSTWVPPAPTTPPIAGASRALVSIPDVSDATARLPHEPAVRRAFEIALGRPNINALQSVAATNAVSSLDLRRADQLRQAVGWERAALAFGTDVIVAADGMTWSSFIRAEALPAGLALYRAEPPPPPILCTTRFALARNPTEAAQFVARDVRTIELAGPPPDEGAAGPDRACRLERTSGSEITVHLAATPATVLVATTESYYPGWQAAADGRPIAVGPAQLAFLGVLAPPGTQTVVFRYRPPWFWPAVAVSSLTVAGLALASAWHRRRRREPNRA
jgi:hypothetical protein